ncbi:MAG: hypothetical protein AAF311_11320 [Pseudomonadota bacterium]
MTPAQRRRAEAAIELLIEMLDAEDGDVDLEDGDEDGSPYDDMELEPEDLWLLGAIVTDTLHT